MTKITPESMKKQYEELWTTFCKKNHDYGNSFEQSLDKHGLIAGVVRMEDKMNRISTLVDGHKQAEIASESLSDTLRDLSNYSAMAACWLDGPDDVYNEENLQKIEEAYARMYTIMRNSHYGVKHHSDGGLTVFYKNGEDDSDDEFGDMISKDISGSITTISNISDEDFDKVFKLASFEGHQEKVNELRYYNREDVSDDEIIKNWVLDDDSKTVRSRTTGQYLSEGDELIWNSDDLFWKIYNVLIDNSKNKEHQPLSVELKGLENGYFIRQHINSHNSWRYTIAFNPEGTIKVEGDVEKPYVIECFSYADGDSNTWALHVFDTREDMVAALNYDLKISNSNESINFGDSIKGLDIKVSVFSDFTLKVLETWVDTFGLAFNDQMLSKNLNTEESIQLYQG
jgi:hypothetical protein